MTAAGLGTCRRFAVAWHVACCLADVLMLWLALAQERASIDVLAAQVGALSAFAGVVATRFRAVGLEGIEGGVAASRRLGAVLEGVSRAELEGMLATLAALDLELGTVLRQLERLKRLKAWSGGLPPTPR